MAKSRLDIEEWVPPPAFDDLDKYSHIWVLFVFHKNTNTSTLLKSSTDRGVTFPVLSLLTISHAGQGAPSAPSRQEHGIVCHTHASPPVAHRSKRGEAGGGPRLGEEAIPRRFESLRFG